MLKINNLNLFVPVMADAETVTEITEMVISTGKQAGTVGLFFFQTRLLRCLIHIKFLLLIKLFGNYPEDSIPLKTEQLRYVYLIILNGSFLS